MKKITIDEEKCVGCGACVNACMEGALALVNGKAKLVLEEHCDGLGNCLPACPVGAISFTDSGSSSAPNKVSGDVMPRTPTTDIKNDDPTVKCMSKRPQFIMDSSEGDLSQWPIQLKLVSAKAPFFNGADVLVAADCTAFACRDFHRRFIKDRIVLIGCPKFDTGDYSEKLQQIFTENNINSVTVARMEVPCCGSLERMVKAAIERSGKKIPYKVNIISTNGEVQCQ